MPILRRRNGERDARPQVLEQDSTRPGLDHPEGALFGNPQVGDAKTQEKGEEFQMSLGQSNHGVGAVKTFIEMELLRGQKENFNESTDLIAEGIIDSLGLMRLVTFLEENCQVQVPDEDMVAENFRTLAAIQSFVTKHQAARKP
jgi:acyl carrier protein